jgi:thiosulfate dehydrogenase
LNFGSKENPEFVGTVAADNPWEGLHKVVNGQPGEPMPVMRGFSLEMAADILANVQSLPVK